MFVPSEDEILRPSGLSSDRAVQVPLSNRIFAFGDGGVEAVDCVLMMVED
jgi:hypothetical protein